MQTPKTRDIIVSQSTKKSHRGEKQVAESCLRLLSFNAFFFFVVFGSGAVEHSRIGRSSTTPMNPVLEPHRAQQERNRDQVVEES